MALSKTDLLDIFGLLDRVQVKGIKEVETLAKLLNSIRAEVRELDKPALAANAAAAASIEGDKSTGG